MHLLYHFTVWCHQRHAEILFDWACVQQLEGSTFIHCLLIRKIHKRDSTCRFHRCKGENVFSDGGSGAGTLCGALHPLVSCFHLLLPEVTLKKHVHRTTPIVSILRVKFKIVSHSLFDWQEKISVKYWSSTGSKNFTHARQWSVNLKLTEIDRTCTEISHHMMQHKCGFSQV